MLWTVFVHTIKVNAGSIVVLDPSVLQNTVCVVENKVMVTKNPTVTHA